MTSSALLLFTLLLFGTGGALSAQTVEIITSADSKYVGTLVSETDDTVVIRTSMGIEVSVPRSSMRSIDYDAERQNWSNGYWGAGGVYGSPGSINIVLERNFGGLFGLRLSGGADFNMAGGELDALFRFARKGTADHHVLLGGGYMSRHGYNLNNVDVELPFAHAGYHLHWRGFNLMLSAGLEIGGVDTYYFGFQIGYVHRFL